MKPEELDVQAAFEQAIRQLYKQGGQSMGKNSCMYRGPNERRCAVGAVLPDAIYNKAFEGVTFPPGSPGTSDFDRNPSRQAFAMWAYALPERTRNMLEKLQLIHDDELNWKDGRASAVFLEIGVNSDLHWPDDVPMGGW